MNKFDLQLAAVHIGVLLADFDLTMEDMPESLAEIESRVLDTFGVDISNEDNICLARDKVQAVAESLETIIQ